MGDLIIAEEDLLPLIMKNLVIKICCVNMKYFGHKMNNFHFNTLKKILTHLPRFQGELPELTDNLSF